MLWKAEILRIPKMGLDVMIDPVIAEKIEVKSLFPFFWDTLYIIVWDKSRNV